MKIVATGSGAPLRGAPAFVLSMLTALSLSACKGGDLEGEGGRCEIAEDCQSGLVCTQGRCATSTPEHSALRLTPALQDFGSVLLGTKSAEIEFAVENTGAGSSRPLVLALAGAAAGDFVVESDSCTGQTLAGGDTCVFSLSFTPSAEGVRRASIRIEDDNSAATPVGTLTGTGAAAGQIVISPTPRNFGTVSVGETGGTTDFTVTNIGPSETGAITATLSGGDALDFSVIQDLCTARRLGANASCTVTVAFAPTSSGVKSTWLRVAADGTDSVATAALRGTASAPAIIRVTPQDQDFGDVVVGESSPDVVFTVTNVGGVSTDALTAALGGTDATEFAIVSNGCSGETLAIAASCAVVVSYEPTTTGPKAGTLDIQGTADEAATANLTGSGIPAGGVEILPAMHDFGATTVNTNGATQIFAVNNRGNTDIGPLSVAMSGANTGDFALLSGASSCSGTTLAAGSSCTISVQFAPTAEGSRTADLMVSAPGITIGAALSGTGSAVTQPIQLTVTPTTQSFGTVLVGSTSVPTTFAVTNTGALDSGVPSVSVSGPASTDFAVAGNGCTTALPPAGTCTIDVTFTPSAAGDRAASLNVSATPGGATSAGLQGFGQGAGLLTPNPSVFVFGEVVNGGSTGPISVVVTNPSNSTTGVLTTTVSSAEFVVASDACDGAALAPNANCTIEVSFAPTTVGAKAATLSISAGANNASSVALSGESLPEFTLAPDAHDFGAISVGGSSTQSFGVTNTEGSGETARSYTMTSDSPEFVIGANTCTIEQPGDICDFDVTFTPVGTIGDRTGSITVTDDTGASHSIAVTGRAAGPILIAPDPLDFGDLILDNTADLSFTVTNNAATDSGILNIEFSGGTSFGMVSQDCGGQPLAAGGGTCTVTIRFFPTAVAAVSGTLTVRDSLGSTHTATVTGNGVPPGSITVTGINNFGSIHQTGTTSQTFTITNTGVRATNRLGFSLLGSIIYRITANSCSGQRAILIPGDSCVVDVTASPTANDVPGTKVTVFGVNGVDTTITTTVLPQLSITPATASFGNQIINEIANPLTFTVTNHGSSDIAAPSVAAWTRISADRTTAFAIEANNCPNIPSQGSCTILVDFAPAAVGDYAGELTVGGPGTLVATADFTGYGIADAEIEFYGSSFTNFGFVEAGKTGATRTFTVRNKGDLPTTSLTTTLTPTTGAAFAVTNNCAGTLAPDATCTVVATFQPQTSAVHTLEIEIGASNASSGRLVIQGTGTSNTGDRLEITPGTHEFDATLEGLTSSPQTFMVRNNSGVTTGPISLTSSSQTGYFCFGSDCPTALPDTCSGQTLAPNQTCSFQAQFKPTVGPSCCVVYTTLTASAAGVTSADSLLRGRRLTQARLYFDYQPDEDWRTRWWFHDTAETTTRTGPLLIRNAGDQESGPITVAVSGIGADIANDGCAAGIPGHGSCLVDVEFMPPNQALFAIDVTATPTNGVGDSVTLQGNGVAAAQIDVTPSTPAICGTAPAGIDDGTATVCRTFTVANIGGVPTGELTLSLGTTTDYVISSTTCPDDDDPDLGLVSGDGKFDPLAAGATCTVDVKYVPDDVSMLDAATFTVAAIGPGGSDTATLEGDSVYSLQITTPATATDGTFTYAHTVVNTYRDEMFWFKNTTGTGTTAPLVATLTGANSNQFSIMASTCTGTIFTTGGVCVVTVRFAPTVVTPGLTATLSVSDYQTPDIKSATVVLTGNGTSPP